MYSTARRVDELRHGPTSVWGETGLNPCILTPSGRISTPPRGIFSAQSGGGGVRNGWSAARPGRARQVEAVMIWTDEGRWV